MNNGRIVKIVLTGGPCGGKTNALSRLSGINTSLTAGGFISIDAFSNIGWSVFRASEIATFILKGGADFSSLSTDERIEFQSNLLDIMLATEKTYNDLANSQSRLGRNSIVIFDRGTMDISVCMS